MMYTSILILFSTTMYIAFARRDIWLEIGCKEYYRPKNCDFNVSEYVTIDDFDLCGPAFMSVNARNYFLASSGRSATYKDNKDAFDRLRILQKALRAPSNISIKTTVLGSQVDFPIGLCPVAALKIVHPEGEEAVVKGLSGMRTVMILSSFSTTLLEDVEKAVARSGGRVHLWMQTYIFQNRSTTIDLVRRAERSGFKAIVLTSDAPIDMQVKCNAKEEIALPPGVRRVNVPIGTQMDMKASFLHIKWLKEFTKLPIVAKGILSGEDAVQAIKAGASAILVSNHGGRQIDGGPATIDALPGVVKALSVYNPPPEVYLDGGVRSGFDVFKAIARGARMVFIGRPFIWGLAMMGSTGVHKVMSFLEHEFNRTMVVAGLSKVQDIGGDCLIPTS